MSSFIDSSFVDSSKFDEEYSRDFSWSRIRVEKYVSLLMLMSWLGFEAVLSEFIKFCLLDFLKFT